MQKEDFVGKKFKHFGGNIWTIARVEHDDFVCICNRTTARDPIEIVMSKWNSGDSYFEISTKAERLCSKLAQQ